MSLRTDVDSILEKLGAHVTGGMASVSPIDGTEIGSVHTASLREIDQACAQA